MAEHRGDGFDGHGYEGLGDVEWMVAVVARGENDELAPGPQQPPRRAAEAPEDAPEDTPEDAQWSAAGQEELLRRVGSPAAAPAGLPYLHV